MSADHDAAMAERRRVCSGDTEPASRPNPIGTPSPDQWLTDDGSTDVLVLLLLAILVLAVLDGFIIWSAP